VNAGRTGTVAATVLAALLALALLAAPASARGTRAERPPTAKAFARATDRVLARPGFRGRADRFPPAAARPAPVEPPLFPDERMLALYGAPQLPNTALGKRGPKRAGRLLNKQVEPYERRKRPVTPAFDLIGVVANSTPGPDRMYRTRQPDELIGKYLTAARRAGARLMLDIQPGRSPVNDEIKALGDWIAQPDVDVAIDPEWNVGRKGIPGRTEGKITAHQINSASRRLQRVVDREGLPSKVLVIHQFHKGSIRGRGRVRQRPGVQVVFNFDGIGAPRPKIAGYEALKARRIFNGFSLFYELDHPLMKPRRVIRLDPSPVFLLYQ
jgi:hypothetical protein